MLLDTASLYFRAFFGVPEIKAPDGTPVNAVRGLLDFIARLVGQHQPTDLVCCWDNDWRPHWRVELIPSYKTHRVARPVASGVDIEETPDPLEVQIPMIEAALEAFGIAVVGADGYEADDVIGSLATQSEGAVDVVTGDRDLFQLVDDANQVRVLYIARGVGNLEILTDSSIVKKYSILPEQYVDFAVMRGDASDGLPGVKGVGEKTAASLLQQHADLPGIRAAAADPSSTMATGVRAKIAAASDYLDVAPQVVAVARDLDLPVVDAQLRPLDEPGLDVVREMQEKWGLGGSVDRVVEALAKTG
jgi:5'-3' exonuclease